MKKQTIVLNENTIRSIVAETLKKMISEEMIEGTPKQNAFLRKLMGDRYDDSYDNLSVPETSAMIDRELQNQRSQGDSRMATPKQIDFLIGNKYHKLPWVAEIQDRLTLSDASRLCDAVSAYKGNRNAGGWQIRTRKEYWIPECAKVTSEIARKYGLESAAMEEERWASEFADAESRKAERQEKKRQEMERQRKDAQLQNAELVFISTQDEERHDLMGNPYGNPDVLNIYMHGKLESAMGWDIPVIEKGYEDAFNRWVTQTKEDSLMGSYTHITVRVEGYDEPCALYLWKAYSRFKPQGCIAGMIIDQGDLESHKYARELIARKTGDF